MIIIIFIYLVGFSLSRTLLLLLQFLLNEFSQRNK